MSRCYPSINFSLRLGNVTKCKLLFHRNGFPIKSASLYATLLVLIDYGGRWGECLMYNTLSQLFPLKLIICFKMGGTENVSLKTLFICWKNMTIRTFTLFRGLWSEKMNFEPLITANETENSNKRTTKLKNLNEFL